jgi:hypothetical protein
MLFRNDTTREDPPDIDVMEEEEEGEKLMVDVILEAWLLYHVKLRMQRQYPTQSGLVLILDRLHNCLGGQVLVHQYEF